MNENLDQDAYNLARAIKKQETKGSTDPYNARGASGEFGAYQFMPATYKGYAQKYLGNAAAPPTVENQNKIAYSFIKEKKDAGFNPAQIASMWNAGEGRPNAYAENHVGTNSKGVRYDVPEYVRGVSTYYQEFKGQGGGQQPQMPQAPAPLQEEETSGALFPSNQSDTPVIAGLKTLGNVPGSLYNFGKGVIDTINPFSTLGRVFGDIPEAFSELSAQQGGAGNAVKSTLAATPQALYEGFVPSATRSLIAGDTQGAQQDVTNDPIGQIAPLVMAGRYGAGKAGAGAKVDSAISAVGGPTAKAIGAPFKAAGDAVGSAVKFGAAQATGLKPETLGTVANNPRAFTKQGMSTIDRKGVADEIKTALDAKLESLDETGAAYGPIRGMKVIDESIAPGTTKTVNLGGANKMEYNLVDAPNHLLTLPELRAKVKLLEESGASQPLVKAVQDLIKTQAEGKKIGATVKVDTNWLERAIRETTGLGVRDGKLVAKPTSSIREQRDVSALQKTYDLWRPAFAKGKLTNAEFLNFRKDLANIAKMDREITRSGPLENLSGIVRGKFNTAYRKQIPGLEKLDEDFAAQKGTYDRLAKGLIDKDGNLTTAGINRVANAVNRGKDLELAKLEELVPGITQKIRILKAIEDIQDASGQKVGTYLRGGLGALGVATLNIPALIASILATPEIAIPILRQYGFAKPLVDQVLSALKKGGTAINNAPETMSRPLPSIPVMLGQTSEINR